MCLVSYFPPGVMPQREHLENGARLNPDGFGFAASLMNGFVYSDHSLNAEVLLSEFVVFRAYHMNLPAMFHSRLGTGTSTPTLDNCHPYWSEYGMVAHNGFLFPADNQVSDTRVFVDEILPLYNMDSPEHRALLEQRIGVNNKIVILTPGKAVHILNREQGITLPDGTWHSNISYTGVSHVTPRVCFACSGPPDIQVSARSSMCQPCYDAASARRALLTEGIR